MKKISYWAKLHPVTAQCIIIAGHLLLFLIATFIGNSTSDFGIFISSYWLAFAGILFFAAIFYYPRQQKKGTIINYYWHRKTCDFIIIFGGFIMLCIGINHLNMQGTATTPLSAASINFTTLPVKKLTAQEILASGKKGQQLNRQEKRILKIELKHQVKIWTKAKLNGDVSAKNNSGLVILAIIGALGLSLLLMMLVCTIACGGAEGAAVGVAIVGFAGIIWLTVFLIKRITHPRHPKENEPQPSNSQNLPAKG